jgi:hypothetical protein
VRENVTRQQVDSLAWDENWYSHDLIPPTEEAPYEEVWITQDDQTTIHYIEDPLISIRYFFIEGSNQEEVVSRIRSSLDTYKRDEICEMMKNAVETKPCVAAIYHVGIAATQEYDTEFFEFFKFAFSHHDPKVRNAAILATGYVGWQEFREPLEHLKKSDTEQIVREFADYTLQSLAKHNWKGNADKNLE